VKALSSPTLYAWGSEAAAYARELLSELQTRSYGDLVGQYAQPLCRQIAFTITKPCSSDQNLLLELAAQVSAAAAEPYDRNLAARGKVASSALQRYFPEGPPDSLRESGFVAISQTLARLMARCWLALLQNPLEWRRLHLDPPLISIAVEELLRYAGLTQLLFRMAAEDVNLNGISIRKGERLVLIITAANRDPEKFDNASSLNTAAQRGGQLTLGLGGHSCVGAPLLRMLLITATQPLIERFPSARVVGDIEWGGGSGFCFPKSLNVSFV
jgi:cytochrome P450